MTRTAASLLASLLVVFAAGVGAEADFDHATTGFPLTGSHARVACESCHVRGMLQGTPTECGVCHDSSGVRATTSKPLTHIPSSNHCDDCHTTASWLTARFDHAHVTDECRTCHNGIFADGKPPTHPPSSDRCEDCHSTLTWEGARFDHAGVTSGCFTCHNGVAATGKSRDHIASGNDCESCHNTMTWSGARFDHAGITGGCATCHNGSTATGKHPGHIATAASCEMCHSTRAWTPASGFDHSGITAGCATCHNGSAATGKPTGHFVTSRSCEECHTTTAWTPDIFRHTSPDYPGEHRRALACNDCHLGGVETAAFSHPAYRPDCAGCHAGDFESGPHRKTRNPETRYTVGELRDCTGACHVYQDATLTTIDEARPGPEHRITAGDF
jgi:hypothetical protein